MPKIDFIYFDAGGGHRAAATALKAVIEQQQRPWEVRLVNLQEVLDPLDIVRKLTSIRLEDGYNLMLKSGWTLGSAQLLRIMQAIVRLHHKPAVRLLAEHWRRTAPDLVVSLVPNFNRALFDSLKAARPATPYITILTDFADYPPHFWIERQQQFFVCGTERAVEQAREQGHGREFVFQTSGMIVRPVFYERIEIDRDAMRRRLGLDPAKPTGIVLFGGQGSRVMAKIAERLAASNQDVQLIMICGRNQKLEARLRKMQGRLRMHVEGFTHEIPHFMSLADFMIGKPGPGSISEAMMMGLPVIIERNAWTMPQERYNAEWVKEKGVGIVVDSFNRVADAVGQMLAPGALEQFRKRTAAIENRAVFEIPEILARFIQ